MAEQGGVKSLVPGGAAEKSCAVDVGHQIIAIGDKDVSSATLEEVSVMLRGPIGSDITLKFLETRQVKLNMERCVYMNDGTPSVGIKWKDGSSEMIVEGMMPGYQGFGGTPKSGDRLLSIDGKSIEHMPDDEIWAKLTGDEDSSVRLTFARGVAHHSVSLTRQTLSLVPASAMATSEAGALALTASSHDGEEESKTIEAAPLSFARDIAASQYRDVSLSGANASPAKTASPASSNDEYMAFQEQSPTSPVVDAQVSEPSLHLAAIKSETDTSTNQRPAASQPLQPFSPNKEMPCVVKIKSADAASIPRIGVNCRLNPSTANVQHFSGPLETAPRSSTSSDTRPASNQMPFSKPMPSGDYVADNGSPSGHGDDYLPAPTDEAMGGEQAAEYAGPSSGDASQLVLKKQLVDIAKRLKREVEEKDLEISSLREAQGDPEALQKLVEKGQEEIRALRERLKQKDQKLADAESQMKHKDSELTTVKSVLMRRAEKSGESKKQLEDLTATFVSQGEEKKALAVANDKLTADLRSAQDMLQQLRESRELDQNNFRDAAEMTVKWKMGQVEKQLEDLRGELKIKRDECANSNSQLQATSQQLAREQETARSNHAKLQDALTELKRLRDSNNKYDSSAKEYQAQCATLEHELRAAGERSAGLSRELLDCKAQLEEVKAAYQGKLKDNDAAWESRNLTLQQEMAQAASEHDAIMEEHNLKYALLQSEMEEARGLMEEARNKILSLEEEKKDGYARVKEGKRWARMLQREETAGQSMKDRDDKIQALDAQVQRLESELEFVKKVHKESVDEMQATFLDEEETLKQQVDSVNERANQLQESASMLQDKVAQAERTIELQSKAIAEERKCTEESQSRTTKLESQLKAIKEEQKAVQPLRLELEVANGRLRALEQLQARVQAEGKQREEFRAHVRGQQQPVPYPHLCRMLEDATVSVSNMQGVVSSKEQEIIFYKSQLSDLARAREMSNEAENQLWKLKESLDWKTIAVQQMVSALSHCQEVMKRHNIPEQEIDEVTSTLAVSQQHATQHDDEIDPSSWPSGQRQPASMATPAMAQHVQQNNAQRQALPPSPHHQQDLQPSTAYPISSGDELDMRARSPAPRAPVPLQRGPPLPAHAMPAMYGSSNNQIHASRDSVLYDSRMSGVNGSLYATPTQGNSHGQLHGSHNGYGGAVGNYSQPPPNVQGMAGQTYNEAML